MFNKTLAILGALVLGGAALSLTNTPAPAESVRTLDTCHIFTNDPSAPLTTSCRVLRDADELIFADVSFEGHLSWWSHSDDPNWVQDLNPNCLHNNNAGMAICTEGNTPHIAKEPAPVRSPLQADCDAMMGDSWGICLYAVPLY
jgi:hypothetical protein